MSRVESVEPLVVTDPPVTTRVVTVRLVRRTVCARVYYWNVVRIQESSYDELDDDGGGQHCCFTVRSHGSGDGRSTCAVTGGAV